MSSLNFRIGWAADLLFKWFLLALSLLCGLQERAGLWAHPRKKEETSRSPMVVPFMFSWLEAWTALRRWAPIPGEGVALASDLPQPSALWWGLEALSPFGCLKGSVGEPKSACVGLRWVNCRRKGADGNRKGRTARFLWGQHAFERTENATENVIRWFLFLFLF